MASVGLLLFLAGVLTGGLLHPITAWYHRALLSLTETPPWLFKTGYYDPLPPLYVTLYLSLLLFALLVAAGLSVGGGQYRSCNVTARTPAGCRFAPVFESYPP